MMVEKIAVCWWRQKRALGCEAGLVTRAFVADHCETKESLGFQMVLGPSPELAAIKDLLSLPLGAGLDRVLRYETTIQGQLAYAINQLELYNEPAKASTYRRQ